MARRARRRHEQQSFPTYAKPLDKNQQLRGARKGERRKNVGRPKKGPRASERHKTRLALRASEPAHVILRAHSAVGSLRRAEIFHAIREALITVGKLEDSFHIVQFSVQRSHVHLLVKTTNQLALAGGGRAGGGAAAGRGGAGRRDGGGRRRRGAGGP